MVTLINFHSDFNTPSTEEYASLLNQTIVALLHNHASIHTRIIRQSSIIQHQLPHEALEVRRFRRKIEKRYFRTLSPEDKDACDEAKLKTRTLIMPARLLLIQNELKNSYKNPQSLKEPQLSSPPSKTSTHQQ